MQWKDLFPYESIRPFQLEFIEDIVASIGKSSAVLSIAPNGFGKTVCALMVAATGNYNKVYYATRTHKQAENVMKMLERINEKAGNTVMTGMELSGKERSCIISERLSVLNQDVAISCPALRDGYFCKPGKNEETWLRLFKPGESLPVHISPVMASEDIMKVALEKNACPYYLSIAMQPLFKVVACSYNHIFDPVVRKSLKLDLKDALVICDEAHNIVDAMESFLTKKLTSKMIRDAGKLPLRYSAGSIDVLGKLDQLLAMCDSYFSNTRENAYPKVKEIMAFLDASGMTRKWASFAMAKLRDDDNGTGFLSDLISFLHVLANDSDKDVYFQSMKTRHGKERILKVSSMDVKAIIDEMTGSGAGISFMSGTISPGFFQQRLGIEMTVHEYNLPKRNLEVHVADTIPGYYKKLSSYYKDRDDSMVIKGFAGYLSKILPSVPGGTIAFFPSYDFMHKVMATWESEGFIDYDANLDRCFFANGMEIPLYVEKRDDKAKRVIVEYKERTATGKALLLSIFRGGASEGEDFPGDNCRAVFCMGFPVRNMDAGETKFKMRYYDSKKKGRGTFWLNWDAMIAVSQSIGRGIRDPENDKAIAVLLDTRYNNSSYSSLLCGWIRDCIVSSGPGITSSMIATSVMKFFQHQ